MQHVHHRAWVRLSDDGGGLLAGRQVDVGDGDLGAGAGQGRCRAQADTGATAGHQCDAAREVDVLHHLQGGRVAVEWHGLFPSMERGVGVWG